MKILRVCSLITALFLVVAMHVNPGFAKLDDPEVINPGADDPMCISYWLETTNSYATYKYEYPQIASGYSSTTETHYIVYEYGNTVGDGWSVEGYARVRSADSCKTENGYTRSSRQSVTYIDDPTRCREMTVDYYVCNCSGTATWQPYSNQYVGGGNAARIVDCHQDDQAKYGCLGTSISGYSGNGFYGPVSDWTSGNPANLGITCTACPSHARCPGGETTTFICEQGYYKDGSQCTSCGTLNGMAATTAGEGATDKSDCYIPSTYTFTNATGTWHFTQNCPACATGVSCLTQSDCISQNYTTCNTTLGCCSGTCQSGLACLTQLDCGSSYTSCLSNCCTGRCVSEVLCFGKNATATCNNAGYGACSDGCCINNCGSKGTCTSDDDCTNANYPECNTGTGCCKASSGIPFDPTTPINTNLCPDQSCSGSNTLGCVITEPYSSTCDVSTSCVSNKCVCTCE